MATTKVFRNIGQLMTLKGVAQKDGRNVQDQDLSILKKGAMVVEDGKIKWLGADSKIPKPYSKLKSFDCQGKNVFPGFVDCHTHMVFAGDRKNEFEARNGGKTYQEIAAEGGGILSTVKATRKSSLKDLTDLAQKRVQCHLAQGVTTIEIKSGYGLTKKAEEKMLQAALFLKGAKIETTFLGAHAIPNKDLGEIGYLEELEKSFSDIKKKKLSSRIDIFIEKNYFGIQSSRDYLEKAKAMGFDITIHADQLSRTGATSLAVSLGAKSADHVICINEKDIKEVAQSQTVAVLLPAADFYLKCNYPKARRLIDQGACVALATDFNPGSSPTQNIGFVGVLARLEMKMTLAEVFAAFTYGGAKALGLEKKRGILAPGYEADFFISDSNWSEFFYDAHPTAVWKTFVSGNNISF